MAMDECFCSEKVIMYFARTTKPTLLSRIALQVINGERKGLFRLRKKVGKSVKTPTDVFQAAFVCLPMPPLPVSNANTSLE